MKCVQMKARLFRTFGIQAEPVFVVEGDGGFGFTHGFMVEIDRHRRAGHFGLEFAL